jgi:DNA replication protein DnaC
MLGAAKAFVDQATVGAISATEPYWLSFCGTVGTGKTLLADITLSQLRRVKALVDHPTLKCGIIRKHWPKVMTRIYSGEFWHIDDMADANLLMLDEIACARDPNGTERESLWRVLSARAFKWTIITSNYSLEKISTLIDTRIASRMVRDGSVVIAANTEDFANR